MRPSNDVAYAGYQLPHTLVASGDSTGIKESPISTLIKSSGINQQIDLYENCVKIYRNRRRRQMDRAGGKRHDDRGKGRSRAQAGRPIALTI